MNCKYNQNCDYWYRQCPLWKSGVNGKAEPPITTIINFQKALKFILYTYHTSFIGQSTLALALLVLKADCLPENSYFPVGCVDNRCACYSCVIYLLLHRLWFFPFLAVSCWLLPRTGNALSNWSCQILIFAISGCVPDWLIDCLVDCSLTAWLPPWLPACLIWLLCTCTIWNSTTLGLY